MTLAKLFCRDTLFHFLTRIRIDSVMHPRSSSRGRNTSASVTVTVSSSVVVNVFYFYLAGAS